MLSKDWKYIGGLRLTKSGIECVILAGSSLFQLSRARSRYSMVVGDLPSAHSANRNFSRIFVRFSTFSELLISLLALKSPKFAGPQGH